MVISYSCSAGTKLTWILSLLLILVAATQVHGVSPPGFLNVDCGLTNRSTYNDTDTTLTYVSDREFVESGKSYDIMAQYMADATNEQEKTLRSFPDGQRNCYTLPTNSSKKYLIRATFTYGNYDGLNSSEKGSLFIFGLHIGVNFWTTVNLTNWDSSSTVWKEVITVAPDKSISVCLINLGSGTPFISTLDLRPLQDTMYPFVNASTSVSYFSRLRFGSVDEYITRFPKDQYDRFWESWVFPKNTFPWVNMSSNGKVAALPNIDTFGLPQDILGSASTINGNYSWLNISVSGSNSLATDLELLPVFHFVELGNNGSKRIFDIYNVDEPQEPQALFSNFSPPSFLSSMFHNWFLRKGRRAYFQLRKTPDSQLPPLINAYEVYSRVQVENFTTASSDVDSMKTIKEKYMVIKNWNGDPCSPREYIWNGLTCTYPNGGQNPRIVEINLSGSGLQGELEISFMKMSSLKKLDLSHNNLTGTIPDYQVNSLTVIDLSNNQLNGSIPDSILQRYKAGLLELRLEGNPICSKVRASYCGNKKNTRTRILLISVLVPVTSLLVVLFIFWRLCWKGKSRKSEEEDYDMYEEETPLHIDIRRFTYAELKLITNNFQSIIGKGGFGTVYHGILENNDEVAVKVLVETSIAESKDFLPEVQTLSKVHHKNLVALVGYCQNKKCLALVYDFMPRGNLQQLLRGGYDSLNWEERLHIALDAAQGLEYLHESCTPSIVHRDVKTPNILLDKNLVAKISDFGLSRAFNAAHTHISTVAAGTLGYLDPEYHATFQLTVKTDVYSFGIVLLEIVTGQPPVFMDPQTVHLPNWVRQKIANGSVHDVVDKKLLDQYDATHLQTVIDLAMNCLENASIDRPSMTEVVSVLKVCLPISSERQSATSTPRKKNVMDAEIPRQFQLMISGASTTSYEGSSFQSGYTGGVSEISHISGRNPDTTTPLAPGKKTPCGLASQAAQRHAENYRFLSIDCGYTDSAGYVDKNTTLTYVSDKGYVEGGKNFSILAQYMKDATNKQEETLRSFPDGQRNCYTLPTNRSKKYLIRATFTYGNYDGRNSSESGSPFLFGLHIGINFWTMVNLTKLPSSDRVWKELIMVTPDDSISVCLINNGSGIPFISTLDLRPLQDTMYPFVNVSVAVSYFSRLRFGQVNDVITRYPEDVYDRFWEGAFHTRSYPWIDLSTTQEVKRLPGDEKFMVPNTILQKASTIDSKYSWLNITVRGADNLLGSGDLELLPIFHFAEIASTTRLFDIYSDGEELFASFSPSPFQVDSMYQNGQFLRRVSSAFTLRKQLTSQLPPPLINAFEVYSLVRIATASDDGEQNSGLNSDIFVYTLYSRAKWIEPFVNCDLAGKSKEHDDYDMYEEDTPLNTDTRRFTYTELKTITNNFQSIIGKGGFGMVYHGILDNGEEVAVKVLRETSITLSKDFLPEVQILSKVQHKNLVTFLGYCLNKKCLALVYDFMARGNLQEVLRGGLEYLHESCTPPIVHRDVKTANILLDNNLVAMISDFGLSRSYTPAHTHISTVAAGTVGYLDPEYHATFHLTVKADVYSFGIVLLEIITGQPSVLVDSEPVHLPNWVHQKIAEGSIHDAVDSRLRHQYDAISVQSVIDLAMSCVENTSIDRPSMTDIVIKLKECLPAGTGEMQLVSRSYKQKEAMDTDIVRQFQLPISGVSIESIEGNSSGTTELRYPSGSSQAAAPPAIAPFLRRLHRQPRRFHRPWPGISPPQGSGCRRLGVGELAEGANGSAVVQAAAAACSRPRLRLGHPLRPPPHAAGSPPRGPRTKIKAIVYCCLMSTEARWLLAFQIFLATSMIQVHAPTPPGFTNIDCGFVDGESYTDSTTNLTYVPDHEFVEGGTHHVVVPKLISGSTDEQEKTLRSFPDGQRNCYTIPSTSGKKYLIRATFTYGNYDGLRSSENGSLFLFGLHVGVNFWTTVNLTKQNSSDTIWKEVLTVAPDEFISVCLLNFGSGTPFISALELWQLDDPMYPFLNLSMSVSYFTRQRFGAVDDFITSPTLLPPPPPWLNLTTNQTVNKLPGNDSFQVPTLILQKASTINSSFSWLNISVRAGDNLNGQSLELLPIFHFAEIEKNSPNRTFQIYSDGDQLHQAFSPSYLQVDSMYPRDRYLHESGTTFTLRKTNSSELPPLINAFEVYSLVQMENLSTDTIDVSSIKQVKTQYNVQRRSWNGDPCSPKEYTWEGVKCNYYDGKQNPRIILVNLSASRLSGWINPSFRNMSLEILDLSHNNLSGTIPYNQVNSLKSLNLSYNQLSGSIPDYLFERYKAGLLELRLEGNPMCSNISESYCATQADKAKKNTATLLIAVIVPVVAIILVLILWMLCCKGKSKEHDDYDMYEEETSLHTDTRRFTYTELRTITNNFQSIIGKGGFGTVYHGILGNGEEVAVKVLRETSRALSKDFLPEVQTLSKVHHKNLVTFLGYCQNKKCLALVYDFMSRGNLQEVLRRGLEYLHESCTPAIVHRDVKTANILLDENLVAMISDFGLSRSYTPSHTHISTIAAGTVGYLDPEYHATFQLTVKADVYSFGIVLLEIITGQPSVLVDPEPVHLPNWVRQKIARGSIHDAVDSRLMHQYDATSVQSVIDLAMNCVGNVSIDRPSMTDIVIKLKECLLAGTGEKQLVSGSYKQKGAMDADIARQFQLLISGVPTVSNECISSGITELSYYSGRSTVEQVGA
uniref:non-specific serine/threonine protein kinase n=1 Tax=Oryza glumipatula TaxID=40148 RepID=A0A0D9Y9N1_9ORYZ